MKTRRHLTGALLFVITIILVLVRFQEHSAPPIPSVVEKRPMEQKKDRPLLQAATKVTSLRRLNQPWLDQPDYQWLSNEEVLVFEAARKDTPQQFLWIRYNLKTGARQPLLQLSQHFNRTDSFPTWSVLSPDGNWLLWQGMDDKPTGDGTHHPVYASHEYAATLDGKRFVQWPDSFGSMHWAADNRHWISLSREIDRVGSDIPDQVLLFDVEAPQSKKVIPLVRDSALNKNLVRPFPILLDEEALPFNQAIWRSDSELVLRTWGQSGSEEVELRDVNLYHCRQPIQRHFVHLPMPSCIKSVQFSPQADRIAWLLCEEKALGRVKVGLYVCQADGTDFKEIGSVQVEAAPYNQMEPNDLRWLPDGQHLSFVYQDSLYMISVEPSSFTAVMETTEETTPTSDGSTSATLYGFVGECVTSVIASW